MNRRGFVGGMAAFAAALWLPVRAFAETCLRYAYKGELHKDFHASILDGVNYMIDNYGEFAMFFPPSGGHAVGRTVDTAAKTARRITVKVRCDE